LYVDSDGGGPLICNGKQTGIISFKRGERNEHCPINNAVMGFTKIVMYIGNKICKLQ
jgi:hypothetical protein